MATAKNKRTIDRLEQIKQRAAEMAANNQDKAAAQLAEEAATLALELIKET